MTRLAAILCLMCAACAFDTGGSLGDGDDIADTDDALDPDDPSVVAPVDADDLDPPPTGEPCQDELTLVAILTFGENDESLPDDQELQSPFRFDLPRDMEVTEGAAGCAFLDVYSGDDDVIRCAYQGEASGGNGGFGGFGGFGGNIEYDFVECRSDEDLDEIKFDFCGSEENDGDIVANLEDGDAITTDRLVLTVVEGDDDDGTIEVTLDLRGSCLSDGD